MSKKRTREEGAFQTLFVEHRPDIAVCEKVQEIVLEGSALGLTPAELVACISGYVTGYLAGMGQPLAQNITGGKSDNSVKKNATSARVGV